MKPETEHPCPECGGELERVVVSEARSHAGQRVYLEGLMPFQCRHCKARVWPESERRRAREQAEVKLRVKAAA